MTTRLKMHPERSRRTISEKTAKREYSPGVVRPFVAGAVRPFVAGVPWRDYLDEQLKNPEFRAEYDALEGEFALIRQLIALRIKRGLSQRQLAKRAEMQQPTIARLEGGRTASLKTLRRVAEALDARVEVRLVPRGPSTRSGASGAKGRGTRPKRA